MSQGYKLRFDQMREGNPAQVESSVPEQEVKSPLDDGLVRNLCLLWTDGKKAFYNYAYLSAAEFDPGGEQNLITLHFSSHTVRLYGYSLDALFMDLFEHTPRLIQMIEQRYATGNQGIVTAISVEKING
jgi:hypothetical protein